MDKIVSYIEQDDPAAADRLEDHIIEGLELPTQFPLIGRQGRGNATRELVIPGTPYIAPYRVDAESVTVLRIVHGAQKWPERFPDR